MDFSAFSDDAFDATAWVNAALDTPATPTTPSETHAAMLVTKLQVFIQKVNEELESTSERVLNDLPGCVRAVEALAADARALKAGMASVKRDIEAVEQGTAASMATLVALDEARTRMEDTSGALQEADTWDTLCSSADARLAASDIAGVASALLGMRRSLMVLQEAPDRVDRQQRLETLQEALERLVLPQLEHAFVNHDLASARVCRSALDDMGKGRGAAVVEEIYTRVLTIALQARWTQLIINSTTTTTLTDVSAVAAADTTTDFGAPPLRTLPSTATATTTATAAAAVVAAGAPQVNIASAAVATTTATNASAATSWIERVRGLYSAITLLVSQELPWCSSFFDQKETAAASEPLGKALAAASRALRPTISDALQGVVGENANGTLGGSGGGGGGGGGDSDLARVAKCLAACTNCVRAAGGGPAIQTLLEPFAIFVDSFGTFAEHQLLTALESAGLESETLKSASAERIVARAKTSLAPVLAAADAALDDCISLTGGRSMPALSRAIDHLFGEYARRIIGGVTRVRSLVEKTRRVYADSKSAGGSDPSPSARGGAGGGEADEERAWAQFQFAMQLVEFSGDLLAQRSALLSRAYTAASDAVAAAAAADNGGKNPDFEAVVVSIPISSEATAELHAYVQAGVATATETASNTATVTATASASASTSASAAAAAAAASVSAAASASQLSPLLSQPPPPMRLLLLNDMVHELALDLALTPMQLRLESAVVNAPWNTTATGTEEESLPSPAQEDDFSLSPLLYVTKVGEHLISLPQHLEAFVNTQASVVVASSGDGGGDSRGDHGTTLLGQALSVCRVEPFCESMRSIMENQQSAMPLAASAAAAAAATSSDNGPKGNSSSRGENVAEAGLFLSAEGVSDAWIGAIATSTMRHYVETVLASLQPGSLLVPKAARQLCADIGYLCNVVSALDTAPAPELLLTMRLLEAESRDALWAAAAAASATPSSSSSAALCARVAAARGLQ